MDLLSPLLREKFGELAFNTFVKEDKLVYNETWVTALENCYEKKMENYVVKNILTKDAYLKPKSGWGFDFPGWLGKLEKRDIMVIGLEPHIHRGCYQIVYDFYNKDSLEPSENAKKLYDEGEKKLEDTKDFMAIWYRLAQLFKGKTDAPWDVLTHCYITDLCHFAPQNCGTENTIQKAIGNDPKWKDIRRKVANQYLRQEIEAVDPKIIVCQGAEAYREVVKNLELSDTVNEKTFGYPDKHPYSVKINIHKLSFPQSGEKKICVLGIPHLGSRFNIIRRFWNKKIDVVGKFIGESISEFSIS